VIARVAFVTAAALSVIATLFFVKWHFASAVAVRLDPRVTESKQIADWLTGLAPADPQTHLAAGRVFEKTLDPSDLARAITEYEAAVALSPNDYILRLDLGRAYSLNGDADKAHVSYARAIELAPNYASVQWAYGNSLVRQGKTDEGFSLIAKAAASDQIYARNAVVSALQVFDGDVALVRKALGDGPEINGPLALALAAEGRYAEAVSAWDRFSFLNKDPEKWIPLARKLSTDLAGAKRFRDAATVTSTLLPQETKPATGMVANGGFENGVKVRNAEMFEWQIGDGGHPQIGLGENQPHGGRFSLSVIFNTVDPAAFRSISQTVPVEPAATYEFEAWYRSDLKTSAVFKWEIVDAATSTVIAATAAMPPTADWALIKVRFATSGGSDGVIVRLARDGCGAVSCPVAGKISFDDIAIRQM